jgi:hypothetical protein
MISNALGLIIGLLLTLFIYSYLIGDNPLYRLSIHILVGVSAGYTAVVAIREVLLPVIDILRQNPDSLQTLSWLVPLLFVLPLILYRLPRLRWLGNSTLALFVGVGAAISLLGALLGTLGPQIMLNTQNNPLQTILIAVLTICTLLLFQFSRLRQTDWQQNQLQLGVVFVGRLVLTITLGTLFATILNTSLVLLVDRLNYLLTSIIELIS